MSDLTSSQPPSSPSPLPALARYRSGMLPRFGLLYWLSGLWLILRRLRLEEHSAEQIRRAAQAGPVVYALHTTSLLDWLALNRVLAARRLPLADFTLGLRPSFLAPLHEALAALGGAIRARFSEGPAPDPVASGWLADAVASGLTTCVFLVPGAGAGVLGPDAPDPVEALLQAQAKCERPIQVIPVVVAWHRRPETVRTEVDRVLLGSQDEPGPLDKLWSVMSRSSDALIQAGAPLDLRALVERYEAQPFERRVRTARILLRRFLYREAHVIRGPGVRPFRWMRRLVLESAEVRDLVTQEAAATGKDMAEVRREVAAVLDKVAARLSYPAVKAGHLITRFLFNRIFSGIDIRPEDAERLRAAMRAGTPVLIPCHRSHLDYLLVSTVMFEHDLVVPHVVAGDNLNFWPVGAFFRRAGAFFIKRSFKGDRIFPVVFGRYVRQLIRDGFPIEFFIEGGRSRTGKLLPAKTGVLGMVLDAAAKGREGQEVSLLPIALCYEQIAEEAAYARELAGGKKEREDLGQVVRASKVIGRRYGRVYLRVGEPIRTSALYASLDRPWEQLGREERAETLQRTGERILHRIAENMVVLPSGLAALGLLAQSRKGLRQTELLSRVARFEKHLRRKGAQWGAAASHGSWAVEEALARFEKGRLLHRLKDDDGDILQVIEDKRVTLEYYKNGLLHFFVPVSLMAAAVRACREQADALPEAELQRLFAEQVLLFRYEYTLNPDESLRSLGQTAQDDLLAYGALRREADGRLCAADPRLVAELAELTRNFVESYSLVLRAARALRSRDLSVAALPAKIQEVGRGLLAVEELVRPESLSAVNLSNAVRALREDGLLQLRTDGSGLQLDEEGTNALLANLKRMLA